MNYGNITHKNLYLPLSINPFNHQKEGHKKEERGKEEAIYQILNKHKLSGRRKLWELEEVGF